MIRKKKLFCCCLLLLGAFLLLFLKTDQVKESDPWNKIQEKRLRMLRDTCLQWTVTENNLIPWKTVNKLDSYVVDPGGGWAFCHVPKVASTWWLSVFARIYGHEEDQIHRLIQDNTLHDQLMDKSKPSLALEPDLFKVIFVRHPLERLVSAYEDKIVRNLLPKQEKDFRSFLSKLNVSNKSFTFSNFVDFVLYESNLNKVSFGSLHWMPYYSLCNLCQVNFNLVGKLETFKSDLEYLVRKVENLDKFMANPDQHVNVGLTPTSHHHHMANLSHRQKKMLCNLYKWDMMMFNYTCDI